MTISDFLKLPNFTDLRLLAGKYGLLSEVTNVTVVDTPDGTNWLNGGELVITTAYMLHEEKDLLEFLRTLSSKKAAGVGIKENRYLTEIPESARKLADELHLPLISVPEAYPFVDIINPVLTQIINQQSFLLTQANMIHKEFLLVFPVPLWIPILKISSFLMKTLLLCISFRIWIWKIFPVNF